MLGHSGGFMKPNTFSSYSDASVMKNKYQNIKMIPRNYSINFNESRNKLNFVSPNFLSNFHEFM